MYKFDSEAFIREMESLEGVEETPLDYEDFEQEEYERMNERDLNKQRGQFTNFNGEEFESTWEYDKYVIDTQIKDLEREIQSDLNRIATLEREVEVYV